MLHDPETVRREGVLVVGETLVDVVPDASGVPQRHLGGSAANVALGLARLGRPVLLWTCLADDEDGRWLAGRLGAEGVALTGDPWVLDRTSSARANLDAHGVARWVLDLDWRPAGQPETRVAAVHTGSLAAVLEPGASRVREALGDLRTGVLRSFDVNARAGLSTAPSAEAWLGWPDLLRASVDDLALLWPDADPADLVRRWFAEHPWLGTVVLSDGPRGAARIGRHATDHVPAPAVEVVDTVGAGDALTASVLDGWLAGRGDVEGWTEVVARAVRAASSSVTRPGADPPGRAEL